ncbi:hypothetical protein TIFTF001_000845 [Ficus carica]|uniref:Uncharacterized protein n=1 Tax=Ficus carica TaxID=3494 RepID=A0AA87YXD3_FICCA|nr:hypothetical protein TIFTF001_000845 [Ficus carica]
MTQSPPSPPPPPGPPPLPGASAAGGVQLRCAGCGIGSHGGDYGRTITQKQVGYHAAVSGSQH